MLDCKAWLTTNVGVRRLTPTYELHDPAYRDYDPKRPSPKYQEP
ncbi:MAG: hypothetical protein ACYDBT_06325 [Desulfobulbaceae bacterium]